MVGAHRRSHIQTALVAVCTHSGLHRQVRARRQLQAPQKRRTAIKHLGTFRILRQDAALRIQHMDAFSGKTCPCRRQHHCHGGLIDRQQPLHQQFEHGLVGSHVEQLVFDQPLGGLHSQRMDRQFQHLCACGMALVQTLVARQVHRQHCAQKRHQQHHGDAPHTEVARL